jgi:hypothetical protein
MVGVYFISICFLIIYSFVRFKNYYEVKKESSLAVVDLFNSYEAWCSSKSASVKSKVDFFELLKPIFEEWNITISPNNELHNLAKKAGSDNTEGLTEENTTSEGISDKAKLIVPTTSRAPPADLKYVCRWRDGTDTSMESLSSDSVFPIATCNLKFATESDLLLHIKSVHISEDSLNCRWGTCTQNFTVASQSIPHVRTHLLNKTPHPKPHTTPVKMMNLKGVKHLHELIGIPLTTLLFLRNISRVPKVKDLFLPFESDFVVAMVENPKATKIIAEILWEIR